MPSIGPLLVDQVVLNEMLVKVAKGIGVQAVVDERALRAGQVLLNTLKRERENLEDSMRVPCLLTLPSASLLNGRAVLHIGLVSIRIQGSSGSLAASGCRENVRHGRLEGKRNMDHDVANQRAHTDHVAASLSGRGVHWSAVAVLRNE